jgi:hypothetical protein
MAHLHNGYEALYLQKLAGICSINCEVMAPKAMLPNLKYSGKKLNQLNAAFPLILF